jgi:hypothetical protein
MNVVECVQGDALWFSSRIGMITSSRIGDVVGKRRRGEGELAARRRYREEMACDILTGDTTEHYVTYWMQQGLENEPLARAAYEMIADVSCEQVGLVLHPTFDHGAASPDSLVGTKGGAEYKCPKPITHISYLHAGVVPEEYKPQCYWQMACCEREWWDFVSHCPTLPDDFQTFIVRLQRDDKIIAEMEAEAIRFRQEVDDLLGQLREIASGKRSNIEQQLRDSIAMVERQKLERAAAHEIIP